MGIADALRWRQLADEVSAVAERMTDPDAKRMMRLIVWGYRRLAQSAGTREMRGEPPHTDEESSQH